MFDAALQRKVFEVSDFTTDDPADELENVNDMIDQLDSKIDRVHIQYYILSTSFPVMIRFQSGTLNGNRVIISTMLCEILECCTQCWQN